MVIVKKDQVHHIQLNKSLKQNHNHYNYHKIL